MITALLEAYPAANIGIATGKGLVVIDFDPRHGSTLSEQSLVASHGPWPSGPEVRTGGGGHHLYFSAAGWRVGNTLPSLTGLNGIDVRGDGGFVVAPPSRHISGESYRWTSALRADLPVLPDALCGGLLPDLAARPAPPGTSAYGWAALAQEFHDVASAKLGTRNSRFFAAVARIFELVAGGEIDEDVATAWLLNGAERSGLAGDEVVDTFNSARVRGLDHPRQVAPPFANRSEAQAALDEMRSVVHQLPWPGHAGKRQITVLEAMIRTAMRAGGPGNFAKGVRGIALEAGLRSHDTVITALKELAHAGWLTCLFKGDGVDRPSRWSLHLPSTALQDLNGGTHPLDRGDVQALQHPQLAVGNDAFRGTVRGPWIEGWNRYWYHFGLGKTAWRVLELLLRGPRPSRADIARSLGVHPSTIGRVIQRLHEHGLVELDSELIQVVEDLDQRLDQAAVEIGTVNAARDQRDAYGWTVEDEVSTHSDPQRLWPDFPELLVCPHRPQCPAEECAPSGSEQEVDEGSRDSTYDQ